MTPIKLHIAEASFIIKKGLCAVFDQVDAVEVVGQTTNSELLKSDLLESGAEVLLINYASEGFHASDVMQSLRLVPGLKVVGMTPTCQVEEIKKLLDAGLYGHLLCDCDENEIIDSVMLSKTEEKFFCGKVLNAVNTDDLKARSLTCEAVTISDRELEILQLVAQGLTTKQIAEKVHLSFHTVMTHRKNMMAKLGINNTAGLIIYAVRENLISPNRYLFSQGANGAE